MSKNKLRLVEVERFGEFKIFNGDVEIYDSEDQEFSNNRPDSILTLLRSLGLNITKDIINIEEFFEHMDWSVEFVFENNGKGVIYIQDREHKYHRILDLEEEIDSLIRFGLDEMTGALGVAEQFERLAQKIRKAVEG